MKTKKKRLFFFKKKKKGVKTRQITESGFSDSLI